MKRTSAGHMVNIYVLELKDGKYYVGKTNHTFQRFNQHKSGTGAKWTQRHKVVDLFAFHKNMNDTDENKITIQMMRKYGVRNVRGGSWTKVDMTEREIQKLEKRLHSRTKRKTASKRNRKTCTRCGRTSHTVSKCYARFHANGKSLEKRSTISKKEVQQFLSFYKQERMDVAIEDQTINQNDVEKEVAQLNKLSEESPEEVVEVMQSYSEENESISFSELLLNTPYIIVGKVEEKIVKSVVEVVDAVEKQAEKAVDNVNKSAKKLLRGLKKTFKK